MTEQLFKYAGYSVTEHGQTKARFGNDMVSRIKKLTAKSNTDTMFVELPEAMTKKNASQYLLEQDKQKEISEFNPAVRDALQKVVFRTVPKSRTTVNTGAPSVSSTVVVNEGATNEGGQYGNS